MKPPQRTEAERIAGTLSDGARSIMRREPNKPFGADDWKHIRPTRRAFQKCWDDGLISQVWADGYEFWVIDTPLGLAVHQALLSQEQTDER